MAFRLPTREWWAEIPVLYDTGASMCGLYEDDLSVIAGPHRQDVPTLGMTTVRTGNKEIITRYVEMEATILSEKGGRLTPWIRITVGIDRLPRRRDAIRVCGLPIIRMLYCCSVPTPDFPLIMSDTRHQLHLPPAGDMADRRVYAESMVDPSTSPHPDIKLPEPTEHEVNSWKGDDWKNAPLRDTTWFN